MTKITVTQNDIKLGEAGNCRACPIARATRRALHRHILVDEDSITIGRPGEGGKEYQLPPSAQKFIERFDSGKPVRPITFLVGKRLA